MKNYVPTYKCKTCGVEILAAPQQAKNYNELEELDVKKTLLHVCNTNNPPNFLGICELIGFLEE